MAKRTALGKGLGALFPAAEGERPEHFRTCRIDELRPSPWQPRTMLPDHAIQELAQSIREKGILQPLVVRRRADGYEIIMGERRWRAAKQAGLDTVPVIVREATDRDVMEMALVENLQREDLTPLEQARAYQRLINEFSYTQETLAQRIGKDRSSVANVLRLLRLPDDIKAGLEEGAITMGHARALLALSTPEQQTTLFHGIVSRGLSVRDTERAVRGDAHTQKKRPRRSPETPELAALREELQRLLKTQVKLTMRGTRGTVGIEFYSIDDLERILEIIRRARAGAD